MILAVGLLLTACGADDPAEEAVETDEDVVASASVVIDQASLLNATSEDGSWIVIIQQDLSVDEDIILVGEFTNNNELDRKIALYDQDDDRNLTDRYTLEAPSITVQSPSTRFQGGTFVGDVYVEAENFELIDFTLDGNLYFETEEAEETFSMDEDSTITGDIE
ncbi:hypothetical protein Halsa_1715 [Halanaerobium hydrogeniformans]|uniref:Uncharacterized protein n=1 Tax=Halanaerobium hydrogeniformans TaxID=656519 RepID=E4RIR8_HALHG|nr:hypothetical protein Halsa_1715 [Halanaerobium hydrogeniformans]